MPETEPAPTHTDSRPSLIRRIGVALLIVLATIILFVAALAAWADRILLDPNEWADTSAELLENEDVQEALGPFLVDRVFMSVDVAGELEETLPENLQPLAPVAAAGLQELAARAATEVLSSPVFIDAWREANFIAASAFVTLIKDEGEFLRTTDGVVSLDARALVQAVAERIGVGEDAVDQIPEDSGQIVIVESQELGAIQTLVRILDVVGTWLWAISLALYVVAGLLARGFRLKALRWSSYGFLLSGFLLLFLLRVGGDQLVSAVAANSKGQDAGLAVWVILTGALQDTGRTLLILGVIALVASWLAGPGRRATSVRAWLAPAMRERPDLIFGGYAVVVLIILIWGPVRSSSDLVSVLVLFAFATVGLVAFRRQIVAEFPDATFGEGWSVRGWASGLTSAATSRVSGEPAAPATAEAGRIDSLERLAALRDSDAITRAEYESQKARILAED